MTRDNLESPKPALETTSSFETRPAGSTVSPDVGSSASDVVERQMPSSTHVRQENESSSNDDSPSKPERNAPPGRQAPRPSFTTGWKGLAVAALAALICGAASAWAYTEFLGPSKAQEHASGDQKKQQGDKQGGASSGGRGKSGAEQGSDEDKSSGVSASQIPGFTSADDADTLKKQISHLSQRVDAFDRRLDSVKKPENEPPPGLHTLQVQVTELTKELDETANLPAEFHDLQRRLSAVEQQVKSLRDNAASESGASDEKSSGEATSSSDAKRSTPTEQPAASANAPRNSAEAPASDDSLDDSPDDASEESEPGEAGVNDNDATTDLGVELFQEGRYAQAREVFRRLQRVRPHDARVWYYSALSNGMVTNVWDGETKRLFEKGFERERAGTPASERINAAFAKLKPAKAKQELSHYRHRVVEEPAEAAEEPQAKRYRLTTESFKVP